MHFNGFILKVIVLANDAIKNGRVNSGLYIITPPLGVDEPIDHSQSAITILILYSDQCGQSEPET